MYVIQLPFSLLFLSCKLSEEYIRSVQFACVFLELQNCNSIYSYSAVVISSRVPNSLTTVSAKSGTMRIARKMFILQYTSGYYDVVLRITFHRSVQHSSFKISALIRFVSYNESCLARSQSYIIHTAREQKSKLAPKSNKSSQKRVVVKSYYLPHTFQMTLLDFNIMKPSITGWKELTQMRLPDTANPDCVQ